MNSEFVGIRIEPPHSFVRIVSKNYVGVYI